MPQKWQPLEMLQVTIISVLVEWHLTFQSTVCCWDSVYCSQMATTEKQLRNLKPMKTFQFNVLLIQTTSRMTGTLVENFCITQILNDMRWKNCPMIAHRNTFIIPFVLCMHISTMFQKELDNCFAVVASSKVQRCRVTAVKITTVHRMTMSCYKFLHQHSKHKHTAAKWMPSTESMVVKKEYYWNTKIPKLNKIYYSKWH